MPNENRHYKPTQYYELSNYHRTDNIKSITVLHGMLESSIQFRIHHTNITTQCCVDCPSLFMAANKQKNC